MKAITGEAQGHVSNPSTLRCRIRVKTLLSRRTALSIGCRSFVKGASASPAKLLMEVGAGVQEALQSPRHYFSPTPNTGQLNIEAICFKPLLCMRQRGVSTPSMSWSFLFLREKDSKQSISQIWAVESILKWNSLFNQLLLFPFNANFQNNLLPV